MRPLLSVVVVCDQVGRDLEATVASVLAQSVGSWQLCLVAPSAGAQRVRDVCDAVVARHGSPPSEVLVVAPDSDREAERRNAALEEAEGDFTVFLGEGDRLLPDAVRALREVAGSRPRVEVIYADEALGQLDPAGEPTFTEVLHKPAWSPERLRAQHHLGRFVVVRTSVLREVGGFRDAYDGALDHDLLLRLHPRVGATGRWWHEPQVLCLRPPGALDPPGEHAWAAGQRAVQEHLDRSGLTAVVERGELAGSYRVRRPLDPGVLVSVVIPTAGSQGPARDERVRPYVVEAVRSLLEHAGHEHLEVVLVHDVLTPRAVMAEVAEVAGDRLVTVPYSQRFNFSKACNLGVLASHGSVVVLLNDDVEIVADDFLPRLLGPLNEPDVGMTGAKLLYDDDTLQHAGVAIAGRGPWHAFRGWSGDEPGPGGMLLVSRECVGVTGACLAMRRRTYDEVGGLTEELPLSYNDVDLCLKVADRGLRRVWVADAVAYHFESKSRDPRVTAHDSGVLHRRWALPESDPYLRPARLAQRRREPAPGRVEGTAGAGEGSSSLRP